MNEIKITLTARAGCWFFTVHLDGEVIAQSGNCFTDPKKAMAAALERIATSKKTSSAGGF